MRDRRAHRHYSPEQIKRRAQAINKRKKKHKKEMTKNEMVQIALVILIIGLIIAFSIFFGVVDFN